LSLRFGDNQPRVRIRHDEQRYLIEEGEPLEQRIRGEQVRLAAGEPLVLAPPTITELSLAVS
jgi:hypothetical protein